MKNTKLVITYLIILIVFTPVIIGSSFSQINNDYKTQSKKDLPNIMLTGYWNPTGQMIAPFSTDPDLNPGGWKGENWENRGYNIYSFFPTPGTYIGDFEVDYQDTWEDFWDITSQINPIAIISFGAGAGPWEIEYNARNLGSWYNDYEPPYQPIPCPPDDTKPAGYVRHSTLPVQEISDAVNENTSVNAWVDWNGNPGAFLCEYMAYLGMWYKSIHENDSVDPCQTAGFIHVKNTVSVKDAMEATNITIRVTIENLFIENNPPDAPIINGPVNGIPEIPYNFTFKSTDPDDDEVYYYIKWGDGYGENWIGPYPSGEVFEIAHTYDSKDTFTIEAKAKDSKDYESEWTTFVIQIPQSKEKVNSFIFNLVERFPILMNLLSSFE